MDFNKYKTILITKFGVLEKTIEEGMVVWLNKYGDTEKTRSDFIWSVFNLVLENIGETFTNEDDLYHRQRDVYWDMIKLLIDEGRDTTHLRRVITLVELKNMEFKENNSLFESELIISGTNCCEECDKIDGIKTTIEKELNIQLLPYSKCTRNAFCSCFYFISAKRDGNGRLIWKKKPE